MKLMIGKHLNQKGLCQKEIQFFHISKSNMLVKPNLFLLIPEVHCKVLTLTKIKLMLCRPERNNCY